MPMEKLHQTVLFAAGLRRMLIGMGAGAIAALALPPLDLLPALLLSFPIAIWLIDGAASGDRRVSFGALRSAFGAGWSFGFGYFLAGFWWIGAAFLVESDEFIWALPLGVLGLPAALALFHATGFALARLFWSSQSRRILAFAAAMTTVEWLRSFVLTGFPWNSIGQTLAGNNITAQIGSVVGLHGMTVIALIVGAAPAAMIAAMSRKQMLRVGFLAVTVAVGVVGFGTWRLNRATDSFVADVKIRIMQPNLSQREKHRLNGQETLTRYLKLSDRPTGPGASGIADITHLVWPESPFPFLLAREPQALAQLATALRPKTTLITGAARVEDAVTAGGKPRYYNSMQVIGPDGVISESYDKVHLVPFGEYLPFRDIFDRMRIRQFVEVPGGFEPGARRRVLKIVGLPAVLPLICYEAIFPDEVRNSDPRPGVMLNVTNDAWFGTTFGPHQHLAQARLRSIELGIPLVRAANTGISAVVDPYGRLVRQLPLGVEGVLDSPLPKSLAPTIYAQLGNTFALFLLIICFLVCIRARS
jgi:apolipoprotein N-acyltransferase